MSATQIGVLAIVVAAYALGWWTARAELRRHGSEPEPEQLQLELEPKRDLELEPALLATEAAFEMWRREKGALSPAARRAMIAAAGRLRAVLPRPSLDETSAVNTLARALEDAAINGSAPAEPPAAAQAARAELVRAAG